MAGEVYTVRYERVLNRREEIQMKASSYDEAVQKALELLKNSNPLDSFTQSIVMSYDENEFK